MSLIKNPIFLAVIASLVVLVSTYYVYNMTDLIKPNKKQKKKFELSKLKDGLNEIIILSSVMAGLITWFVASKYLSDDDEMDKAVIFEEPSEATFINIKNKEIKKTRVTQINTDDPTQSINMINTGVNVPKNELNIPNVLIDYN